MTRYVIDAPTLLYIVANDIPKVRNLERLFPESWQPGG